MVRNGYQIVINGSPQISESYNPAVAESVARSIKAWQGLGMDMQRLHVLCTLIMYIYL